MLTGFKDAVARASDRAWVAGPLARAIAACSTSDAFDKEVLPLLLEHDARTSPSLGCRANSFALSFPGTKGMLLPVSRGDVPLRTTEVLTLTRFGGDSSAKFYFSVCSSPSDKFILEVDKPQGSIRPGKSATLTFRINALCTTRSFGVVFIHVSKTKPKNPVTGKRANNAPFSQLLPFADDDSSVLGSILVGVKVESELSNQLDWDELQIGAPIGRGGFGTVHRAQWRGSDVAVKVLNAHRLGDKQRALVKREFLVMSRLASPHVVTYMGATMLPNQPWSIVMEFLPGGTLADLIRQHHRGISERFKVKLLMDVAAGMKYLHSHSIFHRDIKPDNVLVLTPHEAALNLKITDFGTATASVKRGWGLNSDELLADLTNKHGGIDTVSLSRSLTRVGTLLYQAPEVLGDLEEIDFGMVDVYAYAIVMWQMFTGLPPYSTGETKQMGRYALEEHVKGGGRPPVPKMTVATLRIMNICWDQDPTKRMPFVAVDAELGKCFATLPASQQLGIQRRGQTDTSTSQLQTDEKQVSQVDSASVIQAHWRGFMARRMVAGLRKSLRASKELLQTERTYVDQLRILVEFILPRLRDACALKKVGSGGSDDSWSASASQLDLLLTRPLQQLLQLHVNILQLLECVANIGGEGQISKTATVADALKSLTQPLNRKIYVDYCVAYDRVAHGKVNIVRAVQSDPALHAIVGESLKAAARQFGRSAADLQLYDLQSFLICPVQRLPRYVLLGQEIKKGFDFMPTCLRPLESIAVGKFMLEIQDATQELNASKKLADMRVDGVRVGMALGLDERILYSSLPALMNTLSQPSSAKHGKNNKPAASTLTHQAEVMARERAFAGIPRNREFVEEVIVDFASTTTSAKAGKQKDTFRVFLLSDILLVTRPRLDLEQKGYVVTPHTVVAVVQLDCVSRVVYDGDSLCLVEERRVDVYPFVVERRTWYSNPETAPQFGSAITSSIDVMSLNNGATNRLFQSLVPSLSGSTTVIVQEGKASSAALEELLASRAALSPQEWNEILSHGKKVQFDAATTVLEQGTAFAGLYYINFGSVSIVKDQETIASLASRDFFGEMSLVSGIVNSTVITESRCELVYLDPDCLLAALSSSTSSELVRKFFRLVVHSLSVRLYNRPVVEQMQATAGVRENNVQQSRAFAELRRRESSALIDTNASQAGSKLGPRAEVTTDAAQHRAEQLARVFGCQADSFGCIEATDSKCTWNGRKMSGALYILGEGFGFIGRYFGFQQQEFAFWKDATDIQASQNRDGSEHRVKITILIKKNKSFTVVVKFSADASGDATLRQFRAAEERAQKSVSSEPEKNIEGHGTLRKSRRAKSPWDLSERGWMLLRAAATTIDLPVENNVIVTQGKVTWPPTIWQVATGRCRVQLANGEVLGRLRPGDVFGEMSFLFGGAARASVVSLGSTDGSTLKRRPRLTQSGTATVREKKSHPTVIRSKTIAERSSTTVKRRGSVAAGTTCGHKYTSVYELSRPKLDELYAEHPRVVVRFYRAISSQLAARMKQQHDRPKPNESNS